MTFNPDQHPRIGNGTFTEASYSDPEVELEPGPTAHEDSMDENRFPETTAFDGDALGLDPEGCGCTDCIVGHSIPWGSPMMGALALEAARGRRIINRSSSSIILVQKFDGEYEFKDLDQAHRVVGVYLAD